MNNKIKGGINYIQQNHVITNSIIFTSSLFEEFVIVRPFKVEAPSATLSFKLYVSKRDVDGPCFESNTSYKRKK